MMSEVKAQQALMDSPDTSHVAPVTVGQPGKDEVQVESLFHSINAGTDLSKIMGTHSLWHLTEYPALMGNPGCHRVIACGPEAHGFEIGDIVIASTKYITHSNVPAKKLSPVREGLASDRAAYTEEAAVGLHGVHRGGVCHGHSVAVIGLGIIGQFAAQFARLRGGWPVIAVDLCEKRLTIARECGADHVFNPDEVAIDEAIKTVTEGRGADVVIEATGTTHTMADTPKWTATNGRIVVLGGVHGKVPFDFYTDLQRREQTIIAARTSFFRQYVREIHYSMLSGRIHMAPLMTHRFAPKDIGQAYKMLRDNKDECMSVLIDWSLV